MAKNNEVMAKVRVTIGGVEASKKNLEALKASANSLQSDIAKLNKQKLKFIDENKNHCHTSNSFMIFLYPLLSKRCIQKQELKLEG